jgi:hypothetical protein
VEQVHIPAAQSIHKNEAQPMQYFHQGGEKVRTAQPIQVLEISLSIIRSRTVLAISRYQSSHINQ